LQKRKVLSLEWKSEGVMDDEIGELMELVEGHQEGDSLVHVARCAHGHLA